MYPDLSDNDKELKINKNNSTVLHRISYYDINLSKNSLENWTTQHTKFHMECKYLF